jgi:hypothetical protein
MIDIWTRNSIGDRFRLMVFNATFNNILLISWRSALLVEQTGVPGENHRPVTYNVNSIIDGFNRYLFRGHRGRDRIVVGFTTTCAISAYHH